MIEVRWHARAGQGAKTASQLLAEAMLRAGKSVQAFPEYGPERRGAPMRAYTRIDDKPIRRHDSVTHPDVVVVSDLIEGNELVLNQWLRLGPVGIHPYHEIIEFWQKNGYSETRRFCGSEYMRQGVGYTDCEVVLEPTSAGRTQ